MSAEEKSKSRRKREMRELQSVAETLCGLSDSQLRPLALGDDVEEGLREARRLSRSGYRRQIRFLARLLERRDLTTVRGLLDDLSLRDARRRADHHRLERWRDRLIDEGDTALEALLVEMPDLDRQRLRQLVRRARGEAAAGRAPAAAARRLFRLLRDSGSD